jgi:hypothetical protein
VEYQLRAKTSRSARQLKRQALLIPAQEQGTVPIAANQRREIQRHHAITRPVAAPTRAEGKARGTLCLAVRAL